MEQDRRNNKSEKMAEDLMIRSYVRNTKPKHMDIAAIKQKTFSKIREEERRGRHRRMVSLIAVAASVIIIAAIGSGLLWQAGAGFGFGPGPCLSASESGMLTVTVPAGERLTLILADGTKVVANSRTRLAYPRTFCGDTREVEVVGEAYFEVAHDAARPFVVRAGQFDIKVLGTRFGVSNYDSQESSVVLVEGSVELTTSGLDVVRMRPSDKVDINGGCLSGKEKVDPAASLSWMEGYINLDGESACAVAKRLSQYYGVDIVCGDNGGTHLYGKLALQDSLNDVVATVGSMAGLKVVKKGGKIHLVSGRSVKERRTR